MSSAWAVGGALLASLWAGAAFGQTETATSASAIVERLEEIEQRQRILERREEIRKEKAAEATKTAKPPVVVTAEPGKGVTFSIADGSLAINMAGRIVPRETLTVADDKYTNELNIRTARLNFTGSVLSPAIKYQLQLAFATQDFDAGSSSPILDAWVGYEGIRDLGVRAGQQYVPFDRARTTREFALQLVDRQLAVQEFSLDRDVGVYFLSNDLFGSQILSYAIGIFGGEGRNRVVPTRAGYLYVARVSVRPFGPFDDDSEGDLERLDKVRLAIGIAGAYNTHTDRPRSTTGTPLSLNTFNYFHADADLVFKYCGFSFFAEALWRASRTDSKVGFDSKGAEVTEWSRSGWGYFTQAGYMITNYLEIAARWGEIKAIGDTDPALIKQVNDAGRELGGGLNLYLNGHRFKVQADYFHLFGDDVDGKDVARLQLNVML